jgi:hypothetical protein
MPPWDFTPNTDHLKRALRDYYDSRTDEEIELRREQCREKAIIRHARHRLKPEPPESRGHRFQKGNTYAVGHGDPNGEGMIVARTLKNLAWSVYQQNPQLIYDAIVEGIKAEPPRSIPYLALILRCEEDLMTRGEQGASAAWVNYLTPDEHEQLREVMADPRLQRIMQAAKSRMAGSARPAQDIVIDLPPAPQGTGEQ